jgi:hypothetical protein
MTEKVNMTSIKTDFPCSICNKFYASASSLCNHKKKFHSTMVNIDTPKSKPEVNLMVNIGTVEVVQINTN